MMRKILAIILCICMIIPNFSYEVYAAEYEKKQLTIKCLNYDDIKTYEVLTNGENVYIELEDLNKLTGFSESTIDEDDGKIKSYFMTNKRYTHERDVDYVVIYPQEQKIESPLYGEKELKGCLEIEGSLYLDIIEIFNYLRIKAEIVGEELWINLPVYSIFDFLLNDYRDVLQNTVSQLDLLENGETNRSSGFYDALNLACNNFDFKLLIPGWGSTELKDEQYIKAIQTLNEEDEVFYNPETKEYLQEELFDRGFEGVLATGKDLTNVMSIGGESVKTAEEVISNLALSEEEISKYMDLVNWNGKHFDGLMQMRAWSEQAGTLSDVIEIGDIVVSSYETYTRASNWNQECLDDMEVLINLDVNNYEDHKAYVKRMKKLAERCYDESINKEEATANQAINDVYSLLLEKMVTETSVYGKVVDCFVLAVNAGVSIARCFGNVAEEMDKAELSYMVTCLINIAVASRIDAEVEYSQLDLFNMSSNEIGSFRNSLRTFIKSNLRCWSYIYYLNSDGEWENSFRGKEVKNKIDIMNTYLTILNESEQYDYVLDDDELIIFRSKEMMDILRDKTDYDVVVSELIQKHGLFDAEQNGVMKTSNDRWFNGSGVMSATVLDFDRDGSDEMLVCIAEECEHSYDDAYHIKTDFYDNEDGNIILKDTVLLGSFNQSEYIDDELVEINLWPNNWFEEKILINVILIEGEYYIVCENQKVAGAFADGAEQSYWILRYKDDNIQYVGSFTQTEGGSSWFGYTGYKFENGRCVKSDLYYSEWDEESSLYKEYGEALAAFFWNYHINLNDSVKNYTYAYEDRDDNQSILASDYDKIPVFEFYNEITNADYTNMIYEFSAVLNTTDGLEELLIENNSNSSSSDIYPFLGIWCTEGYDTVMAWATSYKTQFNEDGTIISEGYRNKDIGTYKLLDDGTILATFNENYIDTPESGYQLLEYTYTVTYTFNSKNNTLYAEYDDTFINECQSNADSGVLYR